MLIQKQYNKLIFAGNLNRAESATMSLLKKRKKQI